MDLEALIKFGKIWASLDKIGNPGAIVAAAAAAAGNLLFFFARLV